MLIGLCLRPWNVLLYEPFLGLSLTFKSTGKAPGKISSKVRDSPLLPTHLPTAFTSETNHRANHFVSYLYRPCQVENSSLPNGRAGRKSSRHPLGFCEIPCQISWDLTSPGTKQKRPVPSPPQTWAARADHTICTFIWKHQEMAFSYSWEVPSLCCLCNHHHFNELWTFHSWWMMCIAGQTNQWAERCWHCSAINTAVN